MQTIRNQIFDGSNLVCSLTPDST